MSDNVVLFVFGGRRANMELQVPMVQHILAHNPNVEYHVWDLAHNAEDSAYLRSLEGPRMSVITDFAGERPWDSFNLVYRHYTNASYADTTFVKIDDDVVFLETERFPDLVEAARENPRSIISAKVVNNGACTVVDERLKLAYNEMRRRRPMHLLDVHRSLPYAEAMHRTFFDNWPSMVNEPVKLIPTKEWLSINVIAYTYGMGQELTALLDTPHPPVVAGRHFRRNATVGDEGAVNMLPRQILQGMTAGHLTFGPQEKKMSPEILRDFRYLYGEIGRRYLMDVEVM